MMDSGTAGGPMDSPRSDNGEKIQNAFSLHVGNLSYKTDEDGLKDKFGEFGNIVEARVIRTPFGRSRGYAFVRFDTDDACTECIEKLHDTEFEGRDITVSKARSMEERVVHPRPNLYVGELDESVTDEMLKEAFAAHGEVLEAHVLASRADDAKHFGFVLFETVEEAEKAIEALHESDLAGSTIEVTYARRGGAYRQRNPRNRRASADDADDDHPDGGESKPRRARSNRRGGGRRRAASADQDDEEPKKAEPDLARLYVSGLSPETDEETIRTNFEAYGAVKNVEIILDRRTQQPRGYAFVSYENERDAQDALDSLHGIELNESEIQVEHARPKPRGRRPQWRRRRGGRGRRRDENEGGESEYVEAGDQ